MVPPGVKRRSREGACPLINSKTGIRGLRASFSVLGNLRNRGNAGLRYVNGNNDLGNGRWNYGSRHSGILSFNIILSRVYPPCSGGRRACQA